MTEYLWYVVRVRAVPLILVAALGCTRLRKGIAAGFLAWTGFGGGMIMTSAVLKMGLKGLILCLIALTPHFVHGSAVVSVYLSGSQMESV